MVVAGWLHRQQAAVIEYLNAENRLLRERLGGLGRNELDRGKVGAVTLNIARQQRAPCDCGMRANEEVGQHVFLATTGTPVAGKGGLSARGESCCGTGAQGQPAGAGGS